MLTWVIQNNIMKKDRARFVLATFLILGSVSSLRAVEIVPASLQDIVKAMGPDAFGLAITQEALPDLFTLTANRIEEDPKQFTIQKPYTSGRWKGGKAVIEYARDLTYTQVSVYDREGQRQRIYSVRTKFTEQVEQLKAQVQEPTRSSHEANPPSSTPEPEEFEIVSAPKPVSTKTSTPTTENDSEAKFSYEWDDAKGAYVPVVASAVVVDAVEVPAKAEEKPPSSQLHKRRHHHVETETAQASGASQSANNDETTVSAALKASQTVPAKVQVNNTVWVERLPSDDQTPAERPRQKKPPPPAETAPTDEENQPAQVASVKTSVPQVTPPSSSPSAAPGAAPQDQWVPQEVQQKPNPKKGIEVAQNPVVAESVPSEQELLETAPAASQTSASRPSEKKTATSPVVAEQSAPNPVFVPTATPTPAPASSPTSAPASTPAPASPLKSIRVAAPPSEAVTPAAVSSTEEPPAATQKQSGPDTSEGDAWVPKKTPAAVESPEPAAEPVQVAMVPKPAPVDNSVENLLKIAGEGSGAPHESDNWVPQKTKPVKTVDLDQEVEQIRARENKQEAAARKVVKIKQDVNNPEEGVLPVSTFEKFSGPMYGRHREYERRFVPGKTRHAKVPNYNFYVDEVDRKKEIHNVYYYVHQKGKGPRLVAVERHTKVSFLGNYDIEKEDKGKLTTYN
jgi:hypothetical protein